MQWHVKVCLSVVRGLMSVCVCEHTHELQHTDVHTDEARCVVRGRRMQLAQYFGVFRYVQVGHGLFIQYMSRCV